MAYQALYRKYRSSNFDELVGQEPIKQTLLNSLKLKKISHAYLFSGPRGTGKTSVARLFAKALNCEDGIGTICNKCSNCLSITEGSHPDVIEIDAASNSGVDEVRNLIEKVKYAPIKGKYKVYIIDEVHMMTNSAFNALLKTLEEPPSYCVFILCTTEPYKLLPTILSRCQRYEFKKISDSEIKKLLSRVLLNEGVSCSNKALNLIVELSQGGARDSLSILDQAISYCGTEILESDIVKLFGLTTSEEKITLLQALKEKNTIKVLDLYDTFIRRSVDLSRLTNELLYLLKDVLVYTKTKNPNLLSSSDEKDVKQIEGRFLSNELLYMIHTLLECQNEFKTTSNPNFLFQVYLLKLLDFGTVLNQNVLPTQEIKVEKVENVAQQAVNITKKEEIPPQVEPETKQEEFKMGKVSGNFSLAAIEGEENFASLDEILKLIVVSKKEEKKMLSYRWDQLNSLLVDENLGSYAALLMQSKPYLLTNTNLILLCDLKAPARKLNIKANQKALQKIVKNLLGREVCIYALNREDSTTLLTKYRNLDEVNKLPKKTEVEDKKLF